MNLNVKKCKTRSCIQPHADPHCPDYMKYIIIDSENEDEIISKKLFESISNGELPLQDERKSVIMKSKGSANPNFLSNHIEPAKTVDYEISDAEQEVRGLKAECELLEKMISDMIEEQAKLKVSFRKRERRESIKKEESQQHDKKCSFYNYQSSSETRASNEVSDVLREKFSNILVKQPISMTTPLISQNLEAKHFKKSLQIVKTVQIKNVLKSKKTQKATPPKKAANAKQNPSKPKSPTRARRLTLKRSRLY